MLSMDASLQLLLRLENMTIVLMMMPGDFASSHISPAVLAAFRAAGLKYAIIPGGLRLFIQSINVALASFYREEHHKLFV